MEDNTNKFARIKPSDPNYEKSASGADAFGGKPASLVVGLRFTESELHKLKKMKEQGHKNILPELPSDNNAEPEAISVDERIAELEKMISDIKEVINWAEAKRPGSSKNENGSLLLMEYEKETGKKI